MGGGVGEGGGTNHHSLVGRDSNPIRSLLTELEGCTACFKYDSFIAYRG